MEGTLSWRYTLMTDKFITEGPGAPPWATVVKRDAYLVRETGCRVATLLSIVLDGLTLCKTDGLTD